MLVYQLPTYVILCFLSCYLCLFLYIITKTLMVLLFRVNLDCDTVDGYVMTKHVCL